MNNSKFKIKDLYIHSIAFIVFISVTLYYFSPSIIENKNLPQKDIQQWRAGAKELIDFRKNNQKEGLWTNSMFGGMPSTLVSTEYSGDLFQTVERIYNLGFLGPERIFLAMLFSMYIMLLLFGVRPLISIMGAIAFCLLSYHIIGIIAGHNARIRAIAYIPLVLGGVHYAFKKNPWIGALIMAFGLTIELRVNHLQITYYYFFVIVIYAFYLLWESYREKRLSKFLRTATLLFIGLLLAIGCNFGRLAMILDYSNYSIRGKKELTTQIKNLNQTNGLSRDYAFEYNNGIIEPLTMFIPHILGGGSQEKLSIDSNFAKSLINEAQLPQSQVKEQIKHSPTYFGEQKYTLPYYLGATVFTLFILALFTLPKQKKWWLLLVFFMGIVLSWGKNFSSLNYFLFDNFPGYNKFRSVTFVITVTHFSCILLTCIGLNQWFALLEKNKEQAKTILKKTGITLVIGFVLVLLYTVMAKLKGPIDASIGNAVFVKALMADRASLLRVDAFKLLIYGGICLGILYTTLTKKWWNGNIQVAITLLILIIALDLISFDDNYLNKDNFKKEASKSFFNPQPSDEVILNDTDKHYRVANLINPFNDAQTSIHHHSIGGYHGAKLQRYQDLIEYHLTDEILDITNALSEGIMPENPHPVLDMLNTKYLKFGKDYRAVIPNPQSFGNAWFVNKVIPVQNANEEIASLSKYDLKTTAIIDTSKFNLDKSKFDYDSLSHIQLVDYQPGKIEYKVDAENAGFAVFSEIYHPNWKVSINGKKVPLLRADYVLRAIQVPKGASTISFVYEDSRYSIGNLIMWISSLTLILCCFIVIYLSIKKNTKISVASN